jgi:hypothetical protein
MAYAKAVLDDVESVCRATDDALVEARGEIERREKIVVLADHRRVP